MRFEKFLPNWESLRLLRASIILFYELIKKVTKGRRCTRRWYPQSFSVRRKQGRNHLTEKMKIRDQMCPGQKLASDCHIIFFLPILPFFFELNTFRLKSSIVLHWIFSMQIFIPKDSQLHKDNYRINYYDFSHMKWIIYWQQMTHTLLYYI